LRLIFFHFSFIFLFLHVFTPCITPPAISFFFIADAYAVFFFFSVASRESARLFSAFHDTDILT